MAQKFVNAKVAKLLFELPLDKLEMSGDRKHIAKLFSLLVLFSVCAPAIASVKCLCTGVVMNSIEAPVDCIKPQDPSAVALNPLCCEFSVLDIEVEMTADEPVSIEKPLLPLLGELPVPFTNTELSCKLQLVDTRGPPNLKRQLLFQYCVLRI